MFWNVLPGFFLGGFGSWWWGLQVQGFVVQEAVFELFLVGGVFSHVSAVAVSEGVGWGL